MFKFQQALPIYVTLTCEICQEPLDFKGSWNYEDKKFYKYNCPSCDYHIKTIKKYPCIEHYPPIPGFEYQLPLVTKNYLGVKYHVTRAEI